MFESYMKVLAKPEQFFSKTYLAMYYHFSFHLEVHFDESHVLDSNYSSLHTYLLTWTHINFSIVLIWLFEDHFSRPQL
jgi:hypothetical protein